jgi:hypothetical protein
MPRSHKPITDSPVTSASNSSIVHASTSSTTSDQEESSWVAEEVRLSSSIYTDYHHIFECYPYLTHPSHPRSFDILPCQEGDVVCDSPSDSSTLYYTYVYYCIFKKLGVRLPFNPFQCEILRVLNVAPSQLHPNSWAFIRSFEILCGALGYPPSAYAFFSFFLAKKSDPVSWLYMSNYARHSLIKPLTSSWKDPFKVKFFRVRPSPNSPQFFHDESGNTLFPLYWTKYPSTKIKLRQLHCTPTAEKLVSLLNGMSSFKAIDLLRCEGDQDALASLLRNVSLLCLYLYLIMFES